MKRFKKIAAIAMAATMLAGSSLTVFASSEGTDSGTGSYEGFVDETSAFTVDVPTNAANVFNFFVDPNDLLKETGYARLGASESDFESGASLFFTKASGTPKYTKDSDSVTLENQSSYTVDVEVSATVTGAKGITLSADALTGEETDPTLYLAIVHPTDSTPDTQAITAAGGKLTGEIEGVADNFEIKYQGGKYQYVAKTAGTSPWKNYTFNLTGACGGTWTDAQAEAAPVVELTWKITDPKAGPQMTVSTSGLISISNLTADKNFSSLAVSYGTTVDKAIATSSHTWDKTNWTRDNGGSLTIQLLDTWVSNLSGQSATFTLKLSDGSTITTTVTIS